jgi:glycosyltransferase involved in cell wall biosynthesis
VRVTFILPVAGHEGGIRVVAEHARRLASRGHIVTCVSLGRRPAPPLSRRLKDRVKAGLRGEVKTALQPRMVEPVPPTHLDDLPGVTHVRVPHAGPIVTADVPDGDVLISTWWETAEWTAKMPASKGVPVHFVQHDERVMAHDEAARRRVGEATWRRSGVTRIAVAEWLARVGRDEFDAACVVVPNAVDRELFNASPRERGVPPTIGYMEAAAEFKAAEVAMRAAELARERVPGLRVVGMASVLDPVRPLPDGFDIEVRPTQERIAEIYRSCDAWLFASRTEGYGLPVLEAMACRTPVVGTRAGAAPELIGDDAAGRLVPFDDPQAMADAAVEVVTMDAARWRGLSAAAYAAAAGTDWTTSSQQFEAILQSAVDGANLPA